MQTASKGWYLSSFPFRFAFGSAVWYTCFKLDRLHDQGKYLNSWCDGRADALPKAPVAAVQLKTIHLLSLNSARGMVRLFNRRQRAKLNTAGL